MKRITKGMYVDGRKREDVIEVCETVLKQMALLGFLHESNTPSHEMAELLPEVDLSPD